MDFFDVSFWQNFGSNLLATLIGVALGIPVAFWINRRAEAATEKEKKQKILRVLLNELEDILSFVNIWQKRVIEHKAQSWIRPVPQANKMYDETWKAFSDGGELQWIRDPVLLQQIASTYAKVNHVKFLSEKYMDFMYNMSPLSLVRYFTFISPMGRWMKENMNELETSIVQTTALIKENLE